MHDEVSLGKKRPAPVDGTLRKFALRVPECIYKASGILVFGKRIKSLVFSTDLCIIRNVNADAIIAVYPFTPQPVITQALMLAADIPVFAGVGGGLTQGQRAINLAMFAEMQGATGVVLNAPTSNEVLEHVRHTVDIPVVMTVARSDTDIEARLAAGADIFNVSAAAETPDIVQTQTGTGLLSRCRWLPCQSESVPAGNSCAATFPQNVSGCISGCGGHKTRCFSSLSGRTV